MKKTAFIFVIVSLLSACTKNITKYNVDPINPSVVPSAALFTNGERLTANTVVSANSFLNIFRLIEQQWTETQYLNESEYDLRDDGTPDDIWEAFYAGSLVNLEHAKTLMKTDVKDKGTLQNETAIADICEVYGYYYLLTTFGNIPYSQALDPSNPFPKYDDAATVFNELIVRLNTDVTALSTSAGTFADGVDPMYNGDITKWKKFGYTFELKMGMTIADSDPATSVATVNAAISSGQIFSSNDDNAMYHYLSTPPNTNPIWVDLVQSQRFDFVACKTFMGKLKPGTADQDPRTPYFFAVNRDSIYLGAPNAVTTITASDYSLPSGPDITAGSIGTVTNADAPGDLLDYSETEFYLAEAAARGGYKTTGTVESYYNAAITASVEFWGGTPQQAATYLLQSNVTFATADGGTDLQKIAGAEYLAFYNRGWDEWTVNRRLDYPVLNPPPRAYSAFPVRFVYPVIEQNANGANYNQAATAIGGDLVTTKLWFDKN